MVKQVAREVQRPKPKGLQAPKVFGRGTSQGTPFTIIATRLFPYSVILLASGASIWFLAAQSSSRSLVVRPSVGRLVGPSSL